jgi:hypothetical protein
MQAAEKVCVKWSTVAFTAIVLILLARGIFDVLIMVDANKLMSSYNKDSIGEGGMISRKWRKYAFLWEFFSNALLAAFLMSAALVIRAHEKAFQEDGFYQKYRSQT